MATDVPNGARPYKGHAWLRTDHAAAVAAHLVEIRRRHGLDPRIPDGWMDQVESVVEVFSEELGFDVSEVDPMMVALAIAARNGTPASE